MTLVASTPTAVAVTVGGTQQMTCNAQFNNGGLFNVTEAADWITANAAIVTVNNQSLVRGVARGSSFIICQFEGVNGTLAPVNVN